MNSMKTFETSDIGVAAYVMMKGLKLQSATRDGRGRFKFIFEDPNKGGQAPYEVLQMAIDDGFEVFDRVDTAVCLTY